LSEVDREGFDIALIRLPRPAVTVNEDFEENVLPICIDWTGKQVKSFQNFLRP
jgi:hypothetical protein